MAFEAENWDKAAQIWEPMISYGLQKQTAERATALSTAKELFKTQLDVMKINVENTASRYGAIQDAITKGDFQIDTPENMDIYDQAFQRARRAYHELGTHAGIQMLEPAETDLIAWFNRIFDSTEEQHPDANHADITKWGKKDGAWGEYLSELDPRINKMYAYHIWNGLWRERYADSIDKEGKARVPTPRKKGEAGISAFEKIRPVELDTGAPAWIDWLLEIGADIGQYQIQGQLQQIEASKQALKAITETTGERRERLNLPPITATDQSLKMGPTAMFDAGLKRLLRPDTGLIDGIMAQEGIEGAIAKEDLTKKVESLESLEKKAEEREGKQLPKQEVARDISMEARVFLAKLLEYIGAYGDEEAQVLLSAEFEALSSSDKNALVNYIPTLSESEAFA